MARADISALEMILEDCPVLVVGRSLQTQCLLCGEEEGVDSPLSPVCPGCECCVCPACQSLHTAECLLLARALQLGLQLSPEIILTLRLVRLSKQGGELWHHIGKTVTTGSCHVTALTLAFYPDKMMDHVEERKKDAREWSAVQEKVIHVLQKILAEDDICESFLHKLYGIICTNSVTVEGRLCLYPVLSMINHSCVANSCYTFNTETNSVILRAKRRLEAGEEITVCYTDPWAGQPHRREKLSRTWYFHCRSVWGWLEVAGQFSALSFSQLSSLL